MESRIVECIPNFSEGRDLEVVGGIRSAIASVPGLKVLHTDVGCDANRTVITFAGSPEAVCEGAFRGAEAASRLIDMRRHHGEHPRIGATDVLPLVPVRGISLEECAVLARRLASRIFSDLGIPCYCYEEAAFSPERRNLAWCRKGEYESLAAKMADPSLRPDFCGAYDERAALSGASVVGARKFLLAVNFNLDSTDADLALEIARDVREIGRNTPSGRVPGTLKGVKALGWYMAQYGCAQVTMNITDLSATPLHRAYEEVSRCAALRGARVTGTELIGLIPEEAILQAGKHFCKKGNPSADDLIKAADEALGLSTIHPFDPSSRILEYLL